MTKIGHMDSQSSMLSRAGRAVIKNGLHQMHETAIANLKKSTDRLLFMEACAKILGYAFDKVNFVVELPQYADRAAMTAFLDNHTGEHVEIVREEMRQFRKSGVFSFYK